MPNDMTMFAKSGISIAMGQSSDEVGRVACLPSISESGDQKPIAQNMKCPSHTFVSM
jgi:hydroxymethylpyrimidine pyrophosphatase-like HAD family hydrolase